MSEQVLSQEDEIRKQIDFYKEQTLAKKKEEKEIQTFYD